MRTSVDQALVLRKGLVIFKTRKFENSCLKMNQLNCVNEVEIFEKASRNEALRITKKNEKTF